jgi:tetratricopeptide (TPR) repeat protein
MVPPPPGPASPDAAPPANELLQRAERLLRSGDLDGYRRLFAQLASIEDVHARYWAGMQLLELGSSAPASFPVEGLPALREAAATGALDLLEREPAEPRMLTRAGVLLSELGMLDAAEAMLAAARRLDANAQGLKDGLGELLERRRQSTSSASVGAADGERCELAARAQRIAAHAEPAGGLRLSLCMIVRDEQEMLPRCLQAVAAAVDEIVVVDTGSTDATIEIARSFGAIVIERPWTGSFAQARNASFDAASGDWLIYLDADEVLISEDAGLLRSLTARTWREAFYLSETSYTGELDDGSAVVHNALRMFRNRPEYRFEGRLHEQIFHRLPGYLPERFETTDVRVEHFGYLGVIREARQKSRRNIELLELQFAEGAPTPFLRFNLGCEYAAAGERQAALDQFERAWEMLAEDPERDSQKFSPALISRLVKALRLCERYDDALSRAEQGLELFGDFTDLVFEQALLASARGERERAIERCERCLQMGEAPGRYTATVGSGSYLPMLQLAELKRAQGDRAGAIEQLERCVREYPHFVGSVMPYAAALLADGIDADAVVAEVESRMPEPLPAARFMLATALYEAGASGAAEVQFRRVLASQPHSGRARVALAETLLAQRRYEEAAREAAALPDDDPLAAIACRTELFARIAGADAVGAQTALGRARQVGMAPPELELFTAWQQLAATGETAIVPSREVVAQLAVMLEALLRVQDFDAFEKLLGLLERSPVSERERRELLAEMYMRRGFAASAAEEWMSVCSQEPDTRALVGLARVAAVRGMAREAGDFAAAALARDPENGMAADLLVQARGGVSAVGA